ncbi:MAG: TIGR00159 family protein [Gemmatimonadetes bacterium]|nr:MAG: TIGR00159 family protein [Gemmatimonadota bacterium]
MIPIIGSWRIGILDILDMLVVGFIVYRLLLLMQGTRASQMALGLLLLIFASVLAQLLHLGALGWIAETVKTVWVVLFVIVFQPELRRGLMELGRNPIWHGFVKTRPERISDELVRAIQRMAERKIGSIIAIERDVGLRNYAETGVSLEAKVKAELIGAIFTVPSPLHDGAVIIRGNQITAARCILPLSQRSDIDGALGTRHRSALGLSEETDAIVILTSEETGAISVAQNGQLHYRLTIGDVAKYIEAALT